jgi:hypothetical protein
VRWEPCQPRWSRFDHTGMTNFGASWLPVIVCSWNVVMGPAYTISQTDTNASTRAHTMSMNCRVE